ncbi:MAG TPA: PhaM family polyhydroxyalkanoate granule multifunctional regulatory protein [Usitatibacter sp.]|jgi:hypothetical protein|nr:PhaM family polyhydroxyalkanoate granule multifunctional regulatory protein [Usitatibacter sp.]
MTKPVTPQDMFELWQRMVNPGAYPMQSLMFPVLDPKELEKKIAELQVVEHWLKANVNMVQMTMKSLQFQLAMVKGGEKGLKTYAEAVGAGPDAGAQPAPAPGAEMPPNPAMWMWNLMAEATKPAAEPPAPKASPERKPRKRGKA